jgi:predicted ATPase
MDVVDFEFPADQAGRVLAILVEESGRRVSAYSASDGTLRFLAMLAALLGQEAARFYFFEELENGLHPTRLALLLQLIEQQTSQQRVQVVATTHSPQLLGLLGAEARSHAVESYRMESSESTSLARLVDLPDAERIISEQGLARLHASGWIEDAVEFSSSDVIE